MGTHWIKHVLWSRTGMAGTLLIAGVVLLFVQTVMAQQAPQPGPPQPVAPGNPGLIEAIGRWFDEGAAHWRNHMQGAKQKADEFGDQAAAAGKSIGQGAAEAGKGAADATKSAVDAVAKLPTARPIQGRQVCPVAPNGAPDCQAAAETLCRSRGFSTGKSIDFTSSQKCPGRIWVSGQQPNEAECMTETFISRAMCQ